MLEDILGYLLIAVILALIVIVISFIINNSIAYGFVESPPPVKEDSTYNWMESVQQGINRPNIPYTTTNPNGNRQGRKGDTIYYYTGTAQYLALCASPPTVWKAIRLETIGAETW